MSNYFDLTDSDFKNMQSAFCPIVNVSAVNDYLRVNDVTESEIEEAKKMCVLDPTLANISDTVEYYRLLGGKNTISEEEAEEIMLEEQYDEEMFERRANGIGVVSFEVWKKQRELMLKLFDQKSK